MILLAAGSWQVSIWPWLRLFAAIDLSLIMLRAGGLDLDIWAETGVILGEWRVDEQRWYTWL